MLIYISGAITNNPNYQADFKKAEQWLMLKDYTPINPAKFITNLPKLTEEQIMKIDYCLLEMCDGIFMLSGWQESNGACAELSYAKSLGKKVKYQKYYQRSKENEIGTI
jgi:nucleoside 2-deoxyribosyltransferase